MRSTNPLPPRKPRRRTKPRADVVSQAALIRQFRELVEWSGREIERQINAK